MRASRRTAPGSGNVGCVATPDPRSIRIGTAEREQAVKALGEHFAQGRLEPSEFEERMTAAYAARTASELDRLFDDLPAAPGHATGQYPTAQYPTAQSAIGQYPTSHHPMGQYPTGFPGIGQHPTGGYAAAFPPAPYVGAHPYTGPNPLTGSRPYGACGS